jgi:hypothetical protein
VAVGVRRLACDTVLLACDAVLREPVIHMLNGK